MEMTTTAADSGVAAAQGGSTSRAYLDRASATAVLDASRITGRECALTLLTQTLQVGILNSSFLLRMQGFISSQASKWEKALIGCRLAV